MVQMFHIRWFSYLRAPGSRPLLADDSQASLEIADMLIAFALNMTYKGQGYT